MPNMNQAEQLLNAWVRLSSILKNSRITKGLLYNEAIIMRLLYVRYQADGMGMISIKEITSQTKMLKSLVNRTINSLEKKGFLERCEGSGDKRIIYVRCIPEKLPLYLEVHGNSIRLAQGIIDIIGPEDAESFIRIVHKLEKSGYEL